ncbi:hypothetical protein W822_02140 [Advenella kashmirensis W13003]|uniref:Uncharacterized protein n=1 Tax=Advenella kashmirensis W13003 TaxID=1424334 RepID=V8QZ48_9BURK|nr:hypothetical protein [Advenella kashmirensis]ETF04673.1 hypothetical protein W822_02140 [Advenella kashmirensis W13003]
MTGSTDITVRILYQWDEALSQTAGFRPAGSRAALIDWTVLPLPIDESVPDPVMRAVARTAISMGTVAYRLFFKEALPNGVSVYRAPRAWIGKRVLDRMTRTWPADIATAITPEATVDIFFQYWHMQAQTALVLRNDSLSDESMDRLRRARDWRDLPFPADAKLLIAPAVDGEGVLLAAAHRDELDVAVQAVADELRRAGVAVTIGGPV